MCFSQTLNPNQCFIMVQGLVPVNLHFDISECPFSFVVKVILLELDLEMYFKEILNEFNSPTHRNTISNYNISLHL